jgi:hypothetical protein
MSILFFRKTISIKENIVCIEIIEVEALIDLPEKCTK